MLYRQVFSNGGSGNRPISDAAWLNYSASAQLTNNSLGNGTGVPTDVSNVNSSVTSGSQTNGFFFNAVPFSSLQIAVASTAEVASFNSGVGGPLSLSSNLQFSWYAANGGSSFRQHLVLQVSDGSTTSWIASNTAFQNGYTTSFSASASLNTLGLSFDASQWSTLNFDPGSSLSLGPVLSADLTSTMTITGFGILLANNATSGGSQTFRFDTFQIANIPEPSTAALLGLASCGWLIIRRRRSN